ncbi:hypothetical protein QGN31_23365 [Mycobacterium sp. 2-64]|uniref:hypothetical protein n=1 Tax=Mycobacterium sp. 2-64 TaxID=3042319 RepID=UPI002DD8C2CE|nr:hypothetical protein [Mycobacterium sp. 2-64]WSE51011.1 hypothetical protein QGN31_23365 [Mycobacterium sp. 2-64]
MTTHVPDLPDDVLRYIIELRREAERYRVQRSAARREADQLRADIQAADVRIVELENKLAELRAL